MGMNDQPFPVKTYQPGEVLFQRGDPALKLYLIQSGEVDLFTAPGNTFLARLKPGEFFGEQAILSGGVRSATAVAVSDLVCTEVTSQGLQEMVRSQKSLLRPVLEALLLQMYLRNAITSALER